MDDLSVLVIENDYNKARQLVSFVKEQCASAQVEERNSYQSGLKAALLGQYDLVLLDMTLPNYDEHGRETGGRERRYGGVHVLRQLQRKNIKTSVIVVTQFERFGEGEDLVTLDELRKQLNEEFDGLYIGAVFYQAADARWKSELVRHMSSLLHAQRRSKE